MSEMPGDATHVLVHLSGARRGSTDRLLGESVTVGSGAVADIQARTTADAMTTLALATLHRRGDSYQVVAAPGQGLWVNGDQVESLVLASGDVLELGRGGPVLRYRHYPAGHAAVKSLGEAFSDCIDCARYEPGSVAHKAGVFLAAMPHELGTQTSRNFRLAVVGGLVLVAGGLGTLALRTGRMERSLRAEVHQVQGLAGMLEAQRIDTLTSLGTNVALTELQTSLMIAQNRIAALESRNTAVAAAIAEASQATVFLQGAFGFNNARSGLPMRLVLMSNGTPLHSADGEPMVTTEGEGPIVEVLYTGSGFVVGKDGLILTNRHVAEPWKTEESAGVIAQGWQPVMHRLVGYLPGHPEAFPLAFVASAAADDVALVRGGGAALQVRPLSLRATMPVPGEEIVVVGYPLGLQALMARADNAIVDSLRQTRGMNAWGAAARLASSGQISPLATRGIVGNISAQGIIYDAETTHGGSGGPVLSAAGEVVAINTATVKEFGGSNLGVPARVAIKLLSEQQPR
ncbi:MAG: trypsin-like peptidase domain-containing protein [Gemmatimonadales bacterium]|nr:trypsin-like peptidase domain-containing protein [Gemmatimonadales bacterium]MDZ4388884.1 trypsin-like peptidase domain-containing protein [Gemmatimonadales bacterium]